MLRAVLIGWLALMAAQAATAGAWPRETGAWFATVSTQLGWPQDVATWTDRAPTQQYRAIYVEYGLMPRLTLGLDLGRSVSGAEKAIVFATVPVRNRDTGMKASVQFGLGQLAGNRVARPGLSVGWGLPRGWLSFDALAEIALDTGATDAKLDITWGRRWDNGTRLILQVQTGDPAADPPFARLAPSVVIPLNDRLSAETGVTWGLEGDNAMGVKMGLWLEF